MVRAEVVDSADDTAVERVVEVTKLGVKEGSKGGYIKERNKRC